MTRDELIKLFELDDVSFPPVGGYGTTPVCAMELWNAVQEKDATFVRRWRTIKGEFDDQPTMP